jgi:hypothetical protein
MFAQASQHGCSQHVDWPPEQGSGWTVQGWCCGRCGGRRTLDLDRAQFGQGPYQVTDRRRHMVN